MKLTRYFAAIALACLVNLPVLLAADEPPLRVMSFNIRYGTAPDGANAWDNRKDFVVETIEAFDADLLGTQETLGFQRDFLAEQLSDYTTFAAGRQDGEEAGEMMAIYFRTERFEKLDGGHFWYSETPEVPGSIAWDSALPRMASWLKLRDRQAGGKVLWFFNTHFDHRGRQARVESAKILRQHIRQIAGSGPAIVTGDFNSAEGSEPYHVLFDDPEEMDVTLIDTYRVDHVEPEASEGTAGGFQLQTRGTNRIDWIAATPHFLVQSASIDRTARNGVTPSDHFPVTAVLRWNAAADAK